MKIVIRDDTNKTMKFVTVLFPVTTAMLVYIIPLMQGYAKSISSLIGNLAICSVHISHDFL